MTGPVTRRAASHPLSPVDREGGTGQGKSQGVPGETPQTGQGPLRRERRPGPLFRFVGAFGEDPQPLCPSGRPALGSPLRCPCLPGEAHLVLFHVGSGWTGGLPFTATSTSFSTYGVASVRTLLLLFDALHPTL